MTVIVFRYLFRETLKTQLAVLFVLLLIFCQWSYFGVNENHRVIFRFRQIYDDKLNMTIDLRSC